MYRVIDISDIEKVFGHIKIKNIKYTKDLIIKLMRCVINSYMN